MKSTHLKMKRWISKRGGDQEAIRLMRMDWNAQDEKFENLIIDKDKRSMKAKKSIKEDGKNYEEVLASCGARTRIVISNQSLKDSFKVDVHYSEIKAGWEWTYKEGRGLTMSLSKSEKEAFVLRLDDMACEARLRGGRAASLSSSPTPQGAFQATGAIAGTENFRALQANLTDSVMNVEHEAEGIQGQSEGR
jgi:hypothetical protein